MNNKEKIDYLMREIWGENPNALYSSRELSRFGRNRVINLVEEVAKIDIKAANRISERMIDQLYKCVVFLPFDLRLVCIYSKKVIKYAFYEISFQRDFEEYLFEKVESLRPIREATRLLNDEKGFKGNLILEEYA